MYVCLCRGVSDSRIRAAIGSGARTPEEVGRATRAGTDCGKCHPAIGELLREALEGGAHADLSAGAGRDASHRREGLG